MPELRLGLLPTGCDLGRVRGSGQRPQPESLTVGAAQTHGRPSVLLSPPAPPTAPRAPTQQACANTVPWLHPSPHGQDPDVGKCLETPD